MLPNQDQNYSLFRYALFAAGMFFVNKGIWTNDQLNAIVGGIVSAAPVLLSMVFHSKSGQSLVAPPTPK